MSRLTRRNRLFFVGVLAGLVAGGLVFGLWYRGALRPLPKGEPFYVRFEKGTRFDGVLDQLVRSGVVRDGVAFKLYTVFQRKSRVVNYGTFKLWPGMRVDEVHRALQFPIEQQVRVPEGLWIARVAPILEQNHVCTAQEYIAAASDPSRFVGTVAFELPSGSLEGYLYPDTYDLPPMLGAEEVIKRQLRAFEEKVWKQAIEQGATPEAIRTAVVVASMVELEAAVDEERAVIAGVIENRLKDDQRLQIDATVLYALQEWRTLQPGETKGVESPYNTYLYGGLPPGPIGSPAWRSVSAALEPDVHRYFFYVARPNREHFFSSTYKEHQKNIEKARGEFEQVQNA